MQNVIPLDLFHGILQVKMQKKGLAREVLQLEIKVVNEIWYVMYPNLDSRNSLLIVLDFIDFLFTLYDNVKKVKNAFFE